MPIKAFGNFSFFTSRFKKSRRPSTSSSASSRSSNDSLLTPRLVFVKEKCDFNDISPVYGTPVKGQPAAAPAQTKAVVRARPRSGTNGLFLPADVLKAVLAFTPMQQFPQCALVCGSWSLLTKQTALLNLRESKALLREGLQLMAESNTPVRSVKLFSQAIDIYPTLTDASFWKAKGMFILNQEAAAVSCLEAALARRPSLVNRLKLQACIFYAQSNDLRASQLLEMALEKSPFDASIHFELGFCYHGLQQFQKAISCYTRALELNYHRKFVLLANRANCLFRVGRIKESLEDLEGSLKISQFYELALRTRAFVNMHLGNSQLAHRDYTAIIEHATTPKMISDAYCNRAFCYGDMDEEDIERARQADPANPEPVRYKASVLVNRGNTLEAIAHITAWIEANPTHKDCAFQQSFRAELYASVNDWAPAIRDYQSAIQMLLRCPATLNYAGCSLSDMLATYRERLRDLVEEQRQAAART